MKTEGAPRDEDLSMVNKQIFEEKNLIPKRETIKLINKMETGSYGMPGIQKKKFFLEKVELKNKEKPVKELVGSWRKEGKALDKNGQSIDISLDFFEGYGQ